jgi:hypothetical protein
MGLARTLQQTDQRRRLLVTPRLRRWFLEHPGGGASLITPDAIDRVLRELRTAPRERTRTYSASSAGDCLRRQELMYLGAPVTPSRRFSVEQLAIFSDGWIRHIRWQLLTLSAGILTDIEYPAPWLDRYAMGSLDGVGIVPADYPVPTWRDTVWGLEIKGVSPFLWSKYTAGPLPIEAHVKQIARYSLQSGIRLFVVIYENKATQVWKEWLVEITDAMLAEAEHEVTELAAATEARQLHPMLPGCRIHRGNTWLHCPYGGTGGTCPTTRRWSDLDQT